MKTLVLGASGATGKHLVEQLLLKHLHVKIIVRPSASIPNNWISDPYVTIVKTDISKMSFGEVSEHIKDCSSVISCLGHNLTLKGVFGKPRKLVTNAVKLFCSAIEANDTEQPVKFVLMNTSGFRNKDLNEHISFGQKIAIGIIRGLIPPHQDNEEAAEFLRTEVGQQMKKVQWIVVRPDNLIDEDKTSVYETYKSPISSLFAPQKVSRINVAHFMSSLVTENDLWEKWKGKMPVIYNK